MSGLPLSRRQATLAPERNQGRGQERMKLVPNSGTDRVIDLVRPHGFVAQVEKSRYDPYPRRSYATAGTATVVGHPSCVNRLSKATRTCNSVT